MQKYTYDSTKIFCCSACMVFWSIWILNETYHRKNCKEISVQNFVHGDIMSRWNSVSYSLH